MMPPRIKINMENEMPSNQDLYEKIGSVMAELKFVSKIMDELRDELKDELKPKIEKIESYITKQKGIIATVGFFGGIIGAALTHIFKI